MDPITAFAGDWTFVPTRVLRDRRLTAGAKVTYAALARHMPIGFQQRVRPTEAALAEMTDTKASTLRRHLKELWSAGYLKIIGNELSKRGPPRHLYELIPLREVVSHE